MQSDSFVLVAAVLLAGCGAVEQAVPGCGRVQGYVFEATVMSAGFTMELDSGSAFGPLFPASREAWNQTRAAFMDGSQVSVSWCNDAEGRSVYENVEVVRRG